MGKKTWLSALNSGIVSAHPLVDRSERINSLLQKYTPLASRWLICRAQFRSRTGILHNNINKPFLRNIISWLVQSFWTVEFVIMIPYVLLCSGGDWFQERWEILQMIYKRLVCGSSALIDHAAITKLSQSRSLDCSQLICINVVETQRVGAYSYFLFHLVIF